MIELLRKLDFLFVYPEPDIPVGWREKFRSHAFTTSLVKILYGLTLLNPWQNAFAIAPAYKYMSQYFDENVWGALFLIVGAVQMYTLWKDYLRVRSYLNYVALLLMIFLFGMLLASGVASTGLGTYGALMICDMISIIVTRHPRKPYNAGSHHTIKDVDFDKLKHTDNKKFWD